MDYSPSPSRVKPQYAFLDNSIEVGRSEKPFKSSPLKNVSQASNKEDTGLQDMKKRFYNKYSELKTQDFNSMKPSKTASNDTTDRLFKDVGTKVPVDDEVKISSNMVEKIIRENERLKHDKDLVQTFAKGLKEKLLKYKQLNDSLKSELTLAQEESKAMEERSNIWKNNYEKLQLKYRELEQKFDLKAVHTDHAAEDPIIVATAATGLHPPLSQHPKSPEFNFNSNITQDIFGSISANDINNASPSNVQGSSENLRNHGFESVDARIKYLEGTISNNGEKLGSMKEEIEFLKKLMVKSRDEEVRQQHSPMVEIPAAEAPVISTPPIVQEEHFKVMKEDEWVVRETFELNQLQSEVMELHKKLAMREENMKKKSELKRQLLELSMQLERADEPAKKTKSSPPNSPKVQKASSSKSQMEESHTDTKQQPQQNHHHIDSQGGEQSKIFDSSCARCANSKDDYHSQSPKATPDRGSSITDSHSKAEEEPKHFHINGVKWY